MYNSYHLSSNTPQYQGFIYEIAKDNSNKGFLLGTIHATDDKVWGLSRNIKYAWDRCNILAVEVSPNDLKSYLPKVLSNDKLLKVVQLMTAAYKHFESSGVDQLLIENATIDSSYKIISLESPAEHFAGMENLLHAFEEDAKKPFAIDRQVELLKVALDHYKKGDVEKFCEVTKKLVDSKLNEILVKRNVLMADKIEMLMNSRNDKIFTAVGASHLFFKDGLIEILRQRGWTVARLT